MPGVDAIVIGAGMAGLTAARHLAGRGARVLVLDKGRAVGGRMASRRHAGARFDHGAQHFSARSPEFRAEVERWRGEGVVDAWYRTGPGADHPGEVRWVGRPAMRSICEHLASGLDVRTGETVTAVILNGDSVVVRTSDGGYAARGLVLTAPAPQSLTLLPWLPPTGADRLRAISYEPCLAAMAVLDGPSGLPDGHLAVDGPTVAWIADDAHKGVSSRPAVTVHASAAFSRAWLEAPTDAWLEALLTAATPRLGASVVASVGHRWRFARPETTSDDGFLLASADPPVLVAGEAFAGARVEGAFRSGLAAGTFAARTLLG